MPAQAYRLRIRNAANTADALTFTSVRGGTNPYIAAPPNGDGQEVDLLTGSVRTGAYVVEVVDVVTGSDATGTLRAITSQLYDSSASSGRPHLLSRRAFVEVSTDGGATWPTVWQAGYLTGIEQVDAVRYAFTISDTRRIETSYQAFTWSTLAEQTAFPQRGCLFGGPVINGFGGTPLGANQVAIDSGGFEFKFLEKQGSVVALEFIAGYLPPKFQRTTVVGTYMWDALRDFLEMANKDASLTGTNFNGINDRDTVMSYPMVTAIIEDISTGVKWNGTIRGWASPKYNPDAAFGEQTYDATQKRMFVQLNTTAPTWTPTAGAYLRVRGIQAEVSDVSPVYFDLHPVELATKLFTCAGIAYNAASATAITNALGPTTRLAGRISEAQPLADFLTSAVFGPFGFATRTNTSGEQEFFLTRRRTDTLPTYTINTADVQGDSPPPIWSIDEGTVVTAFAIAQQTYAPFISVKDSTETPPPDGIRIGRKRVVFETGDTSTYSTRVVDYDIPGMVHDAASFTPDTQSFGRSIALEGFDRFGRGAPSIEIPVLRTSAAAAAQVGDEVYVNVGYYPNLNYRIGESTIGSRIAQIVRRVERPEGPVFKLVDSGAASQPATAATVSLAASTIDPRRIAQFTITNAATLNTAGNIAVAVEYAASSTTPTTNGVAFTRYAPGVIPTGAVQLPAMVPGTTVWVRVRSEQASLRPSAWTAWTSVALTAWSAPSAVSTANITSQSVDVSWSIGSNTTDDVDVFVAPGSVAPSNWKPYRLNTFPRQTTSTTVRNLLGSTAYIVGVAFRDRVSGAYGTIATTTFSTTGATSGTADRPAGFSIIDGVDDASLPQGVALGLWASVGASEIVIERAPNSPVSGTDYPGTYAELAVVPASTEVYVDSLPKDGTKYWYRIKQRTVGKADSDYLTAFTAGVSTYYGLMATARGIVSGLIRPAVQQATITPSTSYQNPFGSPYLAVDIAYTDPQHRVMYWEYRSRTRTKKTWSAWSSWNGPYIKNSGQQEQGTLPLQFGLSSTSTIVQLDWRVYGSDANGTIGYVRSGTSEWPQNYGVNNAIIKVQKQGYNAGTGKYEVWWRYYFQRGNSTLDEDGDDNTQQTFTTQVVAASVKDQSGTTATGVATSGTKTADGWYASWNSTASQMWTYEVSVDTALPTSYYLQYQDTDALDEQFVAPTIGQTFSGPAGSVGGGDVVGPASATDNAITRFDGTTGKLIQNSTATLSDTGTLNIPTGQTYQINATNVLSATTLGSGVTGSSLTSVGTLTGLTVSGATPLFNTVNSTGTLTLGSTAAVLQEQRFRLINSNVTNGVDFVLNGAGTAWGLYDRTASKWAMSVTRGATDATNFPGSVSVTGALSTSSTLSATSTLQVSSYAAIGGSLSANAQLYVRGTMVGAGVNQYGVISQMTFPVVATSSMQGIYVATTGADGTYTTSDAVGINIQPHTLGVGQTVNIASGLLLAASSYAATTKYGINIGSVSGGSTNYSIFTGSGQARFGDDIRIVSGSLSVTTTPSKTAVAIQVGTDHAQLTSATSYGMLMQPTAQAGVTNYRAIESRVVISATTALTAAMGAYIRTPTITAGGTITTNYGLLIDPQTGGSTNYAIYTGTGLVRFGDAVDVVGNVNLSTGSAFRINSTNVLTATALGTGVTGSSLTSVGTIGTGVWQGTKVGIAYGGTNATSYTTTGTGTRVLVYSQVSGAFEVVTAGGSGQFLQSSGTTGDVLWATPPNFSTTTTTAGYVPGSNGVGSTYFLRADGTWAIPSVGSVSANSVTQGTFSGANYYFTNNVRFDSGARVAYNYGYTIDNVGGTPVSVLTATTLGSGVTASSLTSVGTLTSLTVSGDLTVDTSTLKVDSTNNRVGIGTASPTYALDVQGGRILGTANSETYSVGVRNRASLAPNGNYWIGATNAVSPDMVFSNNAGTENMRLTDGGNLGLGTTSPSEKLHVAGNVYLGGGNQFIRYRTASNWDYYLAASGDNFTMYDSNGTGFINFIYNGGGTSKYTSIFGAMYVYLNGNVGIGTTSPQSLLHINANVAAASSPSTTLRLGNSSDGGHRILFSNSVAGTLAAIDGDITSTGAGTDDGVLKFWTATNGAMSERMRIDASGNLGIGTTSPQSLLHLYGANPILRLQDSDGGDVFGLYTSNTLGFGVFNFTDSRQDLTISNDGNVGIGTTSPGVKLDVVGVIASRFSTYVYSTIDGTTDGNLYITANAGAANTTASNILFRSSTSGGAITERARITSGGDVYVGSTSAWASSRFVSQTASTSAPAAEFNTTGSTSGLAPVYIWNNAESGDPYFIQFYDRGNSLARRNLGYINYKAGPGQLQLVTVSDYRIKRVIGTYDKSGSVFDKIHVHEGHIYDSPMAVPFVLAHELQEAVPYAVDGEKDAVNEDGTNKLQMVGYASLIPLMLAEIKSLRARVAALES